MRGVVALRTVLITDGTLTALVPATRIQAGVMPQGVTLPAISLTSVSVVDRNLPNPGTYRHVSERVQATILAANYPSQLAVFNALKAAGADQVGPTVSGLVNVTIHTDSAGPDFMDDAAKVYMTSIDFRVTYSEAR